MCKLIAKNTLFDFVSDNGNKQKQLMQMHMLFMEKYSKVAYNFISKETNLKYEALCHEHILNIINKEFDEYEIILLLLRVYMQRRN